jgi:hypothetical protein
MTTSTTLPAAPAAWFHGPIPMIDPDAPCAVCASKKAGQSWTDI